MLADIVKLPFIPWTGNEESEANLLQFFEFERWVWFRMWYITIPVTILFIYSISISTKGFSTYMLIHEINSGRNYVSRLSTLDSINQQLQISVNFAYQQCDSLENVVEIERVKLDSLLDFQINLDTLGVHNHTSAETNQSFNSTVSQAKQSFPEEPPRKKQKDIGDAQGSLCILPIEGCGMTEASIFIDQQFLGRFKLWNPSGQKECGNTGTVFQNLNPGTYNVKIVVNDLSSTYNVEVPANDSSIIMYKCPAK